MCGGARRTCGARGVPLVDGTVMDPVRFCGPPPRGDHEPDLKDDLHYGTESFHKVKSGDEQKRKVAAHHAADVARQLHELEEQRRAMGKMREGPEKEAAKR